MINHVIDYTGADKIFYVGHSMGTTTFMAMERYHPELYDKIALASLMAPVAYVSHMKSPLKYLAKIDDELMWILDHLGIGEFMPSDKLMDFLAEKVCNENENPILCSSIIYLISGFDVAQTNLTNLDTILSHTPAGTSTRTVLQYAQEVNSDKFSCMDHGKKGNMERYGQEMPPEYHPEHVTAPVAAYWSDNDWLAHITVSFGPFSGVLLPFWVAGG